MTERSAFVNPQIDETPLSAAELEEILRLQGKMLREVMISNDYKQLLDELCLLAESFTPNAAASIMLYDETGEALRVENGPSLTEEAIEAFNGIRSGDGTCGNAIYHNEAMYVCNTREDKRWVNIIDLVVRFNICSCFSFPIRNADGKAIGTFAISSFEERAPNGFHRALLETCTNICSVILQRRTDDQLRHQILEEQIRTERVESLGILAGGIAHDFNNLLTVIMGNVDLSASSLPPGEIKNGLDLAMKAIESASGLTRQLFSVAKGNTPVRTPSNIGSIITDSAGFALHGSNVSYELTGLDSLRTPVINVDGGQIGQLIQNLLINSRQAMESGGRVQINCAEVDETDHAVLKPGQYLRLTVTDCGTGISEETLEHLFEPYFTTRDTGNGLGLFLCYSIVKSHGGRIGATSQLGKGTEITIHLPLTEGTSPAGSGAKPIKSESFGSSRILIMDDDQLIRRTLRRILEQLGCQVCETKDGNEAIACFLQNREEEHPIDVCILDLTIPGGMGGIETKDALRQIEPSTRIIVSSGYSVGDACIDYKSAGFDEAMMKPYGIATVKQTLAEILGDRVAASV